MSKWTHIVATLYVETFTEDKNIGDRVKRLIAAAPVITGSEANADIFVNPLSGYNTSISCSCNECEHFISGDAWNESPWCEAPKGHTCPIEEYQTVVAITIVGDLRDREINQTRQEYLDFKKYIEQTIGYDIFYDTCSIYDTNNTKIIL